MGLSCRTNIFLIINLYYVSGIVDGTAENGVLAAAPIGGPVPANAFPTISLPSPPNSGATIGTLDFFSIATTVVFVAIAGSFFF